MIGTRQVAILGTILLGLAFLLPVADAPWFSFWREWTAAVAVLLMVLGAVSELRDGKRPLRIELVSLAAASLLLAAVPWLQWLAGVVPYRSDAILVSAYLLGFGLCVTVAQSMSTEQRSALPDRLAAAMVGAALCSVPLAILQWLGVLTLDLDIKVVSGRPVAHMEQTNLLCSLLLQGLFGLWRLNERGRLGKPLFAVLGIVLLLVADLTQSRVCWLVVIVATVAFLWRRRALELRIGGAWFATAAIVVFAGAVLVPWIDGQLGFAAMSIGDRASGGRRPDMWLLFLDAVAQHPWRGWGVQQNGAAQFALALDHPPLMWLFTSAHDVVLDLMVWFGAPVGLLAGAALICTVAARVLRAADAPSFVTALAATALLLHGLVELPLQYAYFLLPLGLMIGSGAGSDASNARSVRMSVDGPATLALLAIAPAAFLALLARDYMPLSDTRPILAYDSVSRHASLSAAPDVPDVLMLDQLAAYHAFAAQRPVPGVPARELAALRVPMLRFPVAPSQEHYAHVLALNGEAAAAIDVLQRSCTFMTTPQCLESHRIWAYWRMQGQALPDWP